MHLTGLERLSSTSIRAPGGKFEFVNYSHPSEARTSRNRKRIRSLVAKKQHQREKSLAILAKSQAVQAEKNADVPSLQIPHTPTILLDRPIHTKTHDKPETSSDCLLGDTHYLKDYHYSNVSALRWYAYNFKNWDLSRVYAELDSVAKGDAEELGLLPIRTLTLALDDPISGPIDTPIAASYESAGQVVSSNPGNLLYLKVMAMAIEEVNAALVDNTRRATDRTIAVVAQMAAYEALFGDQEAFRTHMQGLNGILRLRGGLLALGLDGLMKQFLLWIDSNTSLITGFPFSFKHTEQHPPPNPKQFAYGCCCAVRTSFDAALEHTKWDQG